MLVCTYQIDFKLTIFSTNFYGSVGEMLLFDWYYYKNSDHVNCGGLGFNIDINTTVNL